MNTDLLKSTIFAFCMVAAVVGCSSSNNNNSGSSSSSSGQAAVDDSDNDGVAKADDNCIDVKNADQADSDSDGQGDACEELYDFEDTNGVSTVSYTGQTARHVLIADLANNIAALTRNDSREKANFIQEELNSYYYNILEDGQNVGVALDGEDISFTLGGGDGHLVTNIDNVGDMTLGGISTTKNLSGKIAGNDKCTHILSDGDAEVACADGVRGEFFGWEQGLDADPLVRTPEDLVQVYFSWLADEATKETLTTIHGTDIDVGEVYLDSYGRDYAQLVQKFLLGSVAFSQATSDYMQQDFIAGSAGLKDGENHTAAQHSFDEAFGYYGAAVNAPLYTDLEARGGKSVDDGAREGYQYGYNDADGDGYISIRSEVMLGNSTNCAKRDLGTADNGDDATNYSAEVFDAFVAAREILQAAGDAGELSVAQKTQLETNIKVAAQTWEKCIAATVVHYINEVNSDIDQFVGEEFASLDNFKNLAKHWSEMKGFALGLQFSPLSPFRTTDSASSVDDLKMILAYMGDAPVLANGTQLGQDYSEGATAQERVAAYKAKLLDARDMLKSAYGFAQVNVEGW